MSVTSKYDLETLAYSTQGWSAIVSSDVQKVDDHLHTRMLLTCGEAIAKYAAVYMPKATGGADDGKILRAKGNCSRMPALGLAMEAGVKDEQIRVQRVGPITNAAWAWSIGRPVYLSPTTLGGLTQTPPAQCKQLVGIPESATKLLLLGFVDQDALATTTSTTTSTSTSTSSSTSTSTSTSSSTSSSSSTSTSTSSSTSSSTTTV